MTSPAASILIKYPSYKIVLKICRSIIDYRNYVIAMLQIEIRRLKAEHIQITFVVAEAPSMYQRFF
jgi:hypothetical protein